MGRSDHRNTLWTEEDVERLKAYVDEKLTASQIGEKFGLTRSAILGKLHRLKISIRKEITNPVRPTRIRRVSKQTRLRKIAQMMEPPPPNSVWISLTDLEDNTCRWPGLRSESSGQFLFCGATTAFSGHPYCLHHSRMAFAEPLERIYGGAQRE